jgi:DNA-binding GntR family transcriptional regulator
MLTTETKSNLIARTTVTEGVVCYLRDAIIRGELKADEALQESRVGQILGVSRAPVRESLTILEREGLIAFDRRGTARVCHFRLREVQELGLMRLSLEPVAVRLMTELQPKHEIAAIEKNIQQIKAADSLEEITYLDLDFHRLIVSSTGNKRLTNAWCNLASQFLLVMKRFHQAWNRKTRSVRETTVRAHSELYQAIILGKINEAEAVARRHAIGWLEELEQSNAFAPGNEATQ